MLKETVRAMNDSAGFYRYAIGKAVTLRHVPTIKFFADESFTAAERIGKILLDPEVAKDIQKTEDRD